MDFKNSTIAIATDDGETVSSHFGRARFYEVLNFSDGKVTKRERRKKPVTIPLDRQKVAHTS